MEHHPLPPRNRWMPYFIHNALFLLIVFVQVGYGEDFPVKSSDGRLFRAEIERENLDYFWSSLLNPEEAQRVDFTLLRQQGSALRGQPVTVEGRLLRVEASPDDERGTYYDCWILFDDQKHIPGRIFCARLPETIAPDSETAAPIGDPSEKILYRQERIRATGFYYRQIPFSDGNDLYNAPAIIAESFEVLSAPVSSKMKETPSQKSSGSRSSLIKGGFIFFLLLAWGLFHLSRGKGGKGRKNRDKTIPEFDSDAFQQAVKSIETQKDTPIEEQNDSSSDLPTLPLLFFLALFFGNSFAWTEEPNSLVRLGGDASCLGEANLLSVAEVAAIEDPIEKRRALRRFRLTSDDTEPFYQLLGLIHRLPPGTLAAEAAGEKNRSPITEVNLFNRPNLCRGEAVAFRGNVKRVREIPIHSEKGRALSGLDHYYELYLFTNDSQGYPLVFCTPSLPENFPCSVSDQFREDIRISGIFYKLWGYQSQGDERSEETRSSWKAVPLLFGGDIQWYPQKKASDDESVLLNRSQGITIIFLALTLLFLFYRRLRPKTEPIQFVLKSSDQKEKTF